MASPLERRWLTCPSQRAPKQKSLSEEVRALAMRWLKVHAESFEAGIKAMRSSCRRCTSTDVTLLKEAPERRPAVRVVVDRAGNAAAVGHANAFGA